MNRLTKTKHLALAGLPFLIAFISVTTLKAYFLTPQIDTLDSTLLNSDAKAHPSLNSFVASLSKAIQIETLAGHPKAFKNLHELLQERFPLVHEKLAIVKISNWSLIYVWRGTDPQLPAAVLMGHTDVVPAEEKNWSIPPFSGTVHDGYLYGRGTLDDKASVLGILASAESLLSQGFQPKRTLYFCFGHDEESGGANGAAKIVAWLESQGQPIEMVLDEGGFVLEEVLPQLKRPVAVVGVAEKGYANLKLSVRSEGGHSSMPPPETAIGILSQAIARLESHPLPPRLIEPTLDFFKTIAPEMGFLYRYLFANTAWTQPLLFSVLEKKPTTNALIRTTIASTLISGGVRENVLPQMAEATLNLRVLPGDTGDHLKKYLEEVVQDPRVKMELAVSPTLDRTSKTVASPHTWAFKAIAQATQANFPNAIIAPYLVVGVTDARYYTQLTSNVYRFLPIALSAADTSRIHGNDERISLEELSRLLSFYQSLMSSL